MPYGRCRVGDAVWATGWLGDATWATGSLGEGTYGRRGVWAIGRLGETFGRFLS